MKKSALLAVVFLFFAYTGYSQFSFGVSPGFNFNNAYFGYKFGDNFVPFIGLQYYNAKATITLKGTDEDGPFSNEGKLSAGILAPNIGLKYFMTQENKLKLFLTLNLTKPFLSGELTNNGEKSEDFQDVIDNTSLFGLEFSFGMEYFFDENFSIGGEFGLRYLNINSEYKYEHEYWDTTTMDWVTTTNTNELSFIMNPTFAKISLNYYFSK